MKLTFTSSISVLWLMGARAVGERMHLANYNSMWDSKKGAAFGFTAIAERAGEQLEPHLPKIVPKLYR